MADLTSEEKLTNAETMRHILTVRALLMEAVKELVDRGRTHDLSKLAPPEVDTFTRVTPLLKGLTYGSDEYKAALATMGKALQHHYEENAHHPEHFAEGILGMDLFDLLEMLLDWKAATLRHVDGSLQKSLQVNAERYTIPKPLLKILGNTIEKVEMMAVQANIAVSYPHMEK
jgi:hypothetical protein